MRDEKLSPEELAAWRAVVESSQRLLITIEDDLRKASELTLADYNVLVQLAEAPGRRLRMGDLATKLIFAPSRLTYQIGTMEKRGLVTREPCPDDRRGSEAVLTEAGLAALRAAAPGHLGSVRRHFIEDLDAADLAALTKIFTRIDERLSAARTESR
ncbi:MarR family transcriptional regulator [Asanoa ishikariensis]|uniref:DNA-binding transcriptional regulator, MarR family n=1 Tax=Asanoa ishikariensis TaxID=137265 RepID=A0A1H3S786_9ACTN|nr:MarR family transcriptional regulator [Asanoa ishikariensis]GIF70329.1 MarR family transcriptional regulator [Asanoa ishikariensis]SDZ33973.1 DNA-binding transcriptional regulator, MarR family [Asanoa ishikariensis]